MDITPTFPLMAALVGFTISIPFGPVNIEIIRRVLNHQTKQAIAFAAGAATADGMWPTIVFVGIAPLLEIRWVSIIFWSLGTIILIYLGVSALREHQGMHNPDNTTYIKPKGKRVSYFLGFSLVFSNPLNLVAWLTALGAFHSEGILPKTSFLASFILWLSVFIGTQTLFLTVIFLVRKYKHFISNSKFEKRINMLFGPILLGVAVYFAYNLYLLIFTR